MPKIRLPKTSSVAKVAAIRKPRVNALVTCSAGIEPLVAQELNSIGIKNAKILPGANDNRSGKVLVPLTTRQLYAANVFLRSADRIYVEGAQYRASEFWELEAGFKRLYPGMLLKYPLTADVRVKCRSTSSKLYHEGAVVQRIEGLLQNAVDSQPVLRLDGTTASSIASSSVLAAAAAAPEDDETPSSPSQQQSAPSQQLLLVRIHRDTVTLYVDSSGAPLHQRGW